MPAIGRELGIAKSTAFQLTQGIAWELSPEEVERRRMMSREYWAEQNARRDAAHREAMQAAAQAVGAISAHDLLLVGSVLYLAEGSKSKPWRRSERPTFINSDPDVIRVYWAWLTLIGVANERLKFRVHIHESADIRAAEECWAGVVGVPVSRFETTLFKKHNPRTRRKNVGSGYHGCLIVRVGRSRREYWLMEGTWRATVSAIETAAPTASGS